MKLGAYDQEILRLLAENARLPLSTIGKKIRKSPNFVKYRIGVLKQSRIISATATNINYPALGFKEFIVYLELRTKQKKQSTLFKELSEHPNAAWVGNCIGTYNYRVKFVAKDERHITTILDGLRTTFKNGIKSYDIVEVLEYILGVNRIIAGTRATTLPHGTNISATLDHKDILILKTLVQHPTITLLELSQKIGMTPQGTKRKMKRLEPAIIRGHTVSVNTATLERLHCICRINFKDITSILPTLVSFIDEHRIIGRSFSTFGTTNIELTLFPRSLQELYDIILLLNDTFPEHIEHFDNFIVLKKNVCTPMGVFEEFELLKNTTLSRRSA